MIVFQKLKAKIIIIIFEFFGFVSVFSVTPYFISMFRLVINSIINSLLHFILLIKKDPKKCQQSIHAFLPSFLKHSCPNG